MVGLFSANGQNLLSSTRLGGWGLSELEGISLASNSVPVVAGTVYDPVELPLTGLLPLPTDAWNQDAFVARIEPVPGPRFLPRRSAVAAALEQAVEPYPWGALDLDGDGDSETYRAA